jgi:hypothetical protein
MSDALPTTNQFARDILDGFGFGVYGSGEHE